MWTLRCFFIMAHIKQMTTTPAKQTKTKQVVSEEELREENTTVHNSFCNIWQEQTLLHTSVNTDSRSHLPLSSANFHQLEACWAGGICNRVTSRCRKVGHGLQTWTQRLWVHLAVFARIMTSLSVRIERQIHQRRSPIGCFSSHRSPWLNSDESDLKPHWVFYSLFTGPGFSVLANVSELNISEIFPNTKRVNPFKRWTCGENKSII